MKKVFLLVLIAIAFKNNAQELNVIPKPNLVNFGGEKFYIGNTKFLIQSKDISWTTLLPFMPLNLNNSGTTQLPVEIIFDNRSGESYTMCIAKKKIEIKGNDRGIFYGLQTLAQLTKKSDTLHACTIEDNPAYAYRGMHLDVCRHFFSVEAIKNYIDVMASYKLNTFHWHLTDDQGWRIEIKKYPLLTQIGSARKQTLIGRQKDEEGTGDYDGQEVKGYYTQEQIKEVIKYAADRKITIIPEIEMPGHSLAAIASYPFLSCKKEAREVGIRWGGYKDVFCAGNDSTFTFIEDVLTEVMALFPSDYIHVGGDEVQKNNWKICEKCKSRMKENRLKNENELQSYFIKRIDKFLTAKGKILIGWDEILEGGLAPNATVMSWRGEEGGIAAAKQKHNVVMTPGGYCYFDHSQNKLQEEPLNIGGNTSYIKVYNYNPTPKILNAEQQKYILGAQANVWTEYIADWDKVWYMTMPRMQALSEVLWTFKGNKNLANFQSRMSDECKILDQKNYNYRIPEPIGWQDTVDVNKANTITWQPMNDDDEIYYTWDNNYTMYTKPIELYKSKGPQILQCYVLNKKTGRKSITYKCVVK